jgi:hypothetical protein
MATENEIPTEIVDDTENETNLIDSSAIVAEPAANPVHAFSTSVTVSPAVDANKERLRRRHLGYC